MAKASATAEAAEAPPRKSGKKLLVIVLLLVVVLLIAAAGVIGLLLLKKSAGRDDTAEAAPAVATVDLSKPPAFATLDPFVVNLAPAEGERFLQVVMALRVADAKTGDSLKGFMPEIRHRINLLLSSKLPSELSTLEGREALADQIVDAVNQVLGIPAGQHNPDGTPAGPIRAVLFNSFIIQ